MLKNKITHIIELSYIDVTCKECVDTSRDVTHAFINEDNILISHCQTCRDKNGVGFNERVFKVDSMSLKCEDVCGGDMCDGQRLYAHAGLTHDLKLVAICESAIYYDDDIKNTPYVLYTEESD